MTTPTPRLLEILQQLPTDKCTYERGVVALLVDDYEEGIAFLCQAAREDCRHLSTAPNCEDLRTRWLYLIDDPCPDLWSRLAETFAETFPDSAAVLCLKAWAEYDRDNYDAVIGYLARCLDKDKTFWRAAILLAEIYCNSKNWKAARGYFEKALQYAPNEEKPLIYFNLAQCFARIKDRDEEVNAYRSCLELNPNHPGKENLGWALAKQGKLEEAVEVIRESIRRGNDGTPPYYNLANVFEKLHRFSEGIEVLKRLERRGRLPKSAQDQIAKLTGLIGRQKTAEALPEVPIDDIQPCGEEDIATTEEGKPESCGRRRAAKDEPLTTEKPAFRRRKRPLQIHTEETLEQLIEQKIERERQAFGRRLRVYESTDRPYGRQFAIPDIGIIDLLVEDLDTHELIVIELKRDESEDKVVGQISRYMAWVRENLATAGQAVQGIICLGTSNEKLRLAASNIRGLEVFRYDLTFTKVC